VIYTRTNATVNDVPTVIEGLAYVERVIDITGQQWLRENGDRCDISIADASPRACLGIREGGTGLL
jgi:hypothetical protein